MNTLLRDVRSPRWPDSAPVVALLLHGYGSNEHDLAQLAPALSLTVPWASMRAPLKLGPGAAWFEITTPGSPDRRVVEDATDTIWAWVEAHLDAATRVLPIGFSQGGLMASQLLRTRPERVVAPVILGGFVLGAPQPADGILAETRPPLFCGRGAEDRVIAAAAVERTDSWLPQHTTPTSRVYPRLGHSINAAEVDDVKSFLAEHVPQE
ncbi:MAG: dienelactone hydrolase family protein [Micropruina sp.]